MKTQNTYLKQILNQLFQYASMNFEHRIEISTDPKVHHLLPSIAMGVNMLGEELEATINELKKTNESLVETNKELSEANAKLTKLIDDKETLLQEIHHRVRNNLQIILGLLFMQQSREESAEGKNALKDMQSRVFCISLVQECLYQDDNLKINLAHYCQKLYDSIHNFYKNTHEVDAQLDLAVDVFLAAEKATSLGLMLNELICNCYKHYVHYTTDSVIGISLKKEGPRFNLQVKNRVPEVQRQPRRAKTLGSILMDKLAKQIEADVKTTIDEDYTVNILFS